MTFATLRALHSIIGTAIDDIERVYREIDDEDEHLPTAVTSPNTPPYTPPGINTRAVAVVPHTAPPLTGITDDSVLLKRASATDDSLPPSRERRIRRERAYTLPPLKTFPFADSPPVPGTKLEEERISLDFPSLDEPRYDADRKSPKRLLLQEELHAHPHVISAVNQLVAACGQLAASVQKPFLVLCDAAMGYHLPACLRFLEASHTVEILREAGENGLHVKEISKRILSLLSEHLHVSSAEVDPAKLSHILRLLATHHILREVRPDVFANNRISSYMDSRKDLDTLAREPESKYEGTEGTAAFIALSTDELFKASAYLTDCYLPSVSSSPPASPTSPTSATPSAQTPHDVPILSSPVHRAPRLSNPLSPLRQQFAPGHEHKHSHSTSFSSIASSYGEIQTQSRYTRDTRDPPPAPGGDTSTFGQVPRQIPSTPSSRTGTSRDPPPTPDSMTGTYGEKAYPTPLTHGSRDPPATPSHKHEQRSHQTSSKPNSRGNNGRVPPSTSNHTMTSYEQGTYRTPSTPSSRVSSEVASNITPPNMDQTGSANAQYTPPPPTPSSNFSSRLPSIPQSPMTPRQSHPNRTSPSSPSSISFPSSSSSSARSPSNANTPTSHSHSRSSSSNNWHIHARKGSFGTKSNASLSPMTFLPNPSPVQSGDGYESDLISSGAGGSLGRLPGRIEPPPTPSSPLSLRKRIPLLRKVGSKPLLLGSSSSSSAAQGRGDLTRGGGLGSASTISLPVQATATGGMSKSLLGAPFSYSSKGKEKKGKSKSREGRSSDETNLTESDSLHEFGWEAASHVDTVRSGNTIPTRPEVGSRQPSLLSLKSVTRSPSVPSFGSKSPRPTISPPLNLIHSSYSPSGHHLRVAVSRDLSAKPSLNSMASPSLRSPSSNVSLRFPMSSSPNLLQGHGIYGNDDAYPSSQILPYTQTASPSPSPTIMSHPHPHLHPNRSQLSVPPLPPRSPLRESPSMLSVKSMVVGVTRNTMRRKDSSASLMTSPSLGGSTASLPMTSIDTGRGKPLPAIPPASPSASPVPYSSTVLSKLNISHSRPQQAKPPSKSSSSPKFITPSHPMHAPFNLAFRTSKPYFDWLEEKGNERRFRRFGKAMTGTGGWEVSGAVLDGFPWNDLPQDSIVVDVGGGIGSTSMLLAKAFSHLKFVIQDRPQVAEMGLAAWKTRSPELLDEGRAMFMPHDFFTSQPPIPLSFIETRLTSQQQQVAETGGESDLSQPTSPTTSSTIVSFGPDGPEREGDNKQQERDGEVEQERRPAVFLLRVITHDWPDTYVTRILLQLRKAAGPDTKLLLADYVLPLACVDEDLDEVRVHTKRSSDQSGDGKKETLPGRIKSLAPEGSPLLPNLGKANANAYWLDLTMRVTFNSQERTLRELTALTLTAGWKVVQVTRAEGSLFGHIIAVPVEIPEESLALLNIREETTDDPAPAHLIDLNIYSPPMGDTFFSKVDLPSEDIIRSSKPRFRSKGFKGFMASAGENLGFKSKSKQHSLNPNLKPVAPIGRRKRSRAFTVTGAVTRGVDEGEVPPLPIPSLMHLESGRGVADGERPGLPPQKGGETRKGGWKTLVKMLSKPQMSGVEHHP